MANIDHISSANYQPLLITVSLNVLKDGQVYIYCFSLGFI